MCDAVIYLYMIELYMRNHDSIAFRKNTQHVSSLLIINRRAFDNLFEFSIAIAILGRCCVIDLENDGSVVITNENEVPQ